MFNIPSLLSFSRIPLAFLFFSDNLFCRLFAVMLALITDGLDGYLARKYKQITQFGAMLDPLTDKFFVVLALFVLIGEQRLQLSEAIMMLSRDLSVGIFTAYLWLSKNLINYRVQAIYSGKITTVLQATVLFILIFKILLPFWIFLIFPFLGAVAFIELCISKNNCLSSCK